MQKIVKNQYTIKTFFFNICLEKISCLQDVAETKRMQRTL